MNIVGLVVSICFMLFWAIYITVDLIHPINTLGLASHGILFIGSTWLMVVFVHNIMERNK